MKQKKTSESPEKKKSVNINHIPEVKEKYKVRDFYRHIITYKEHPVSMGWIMDLRQELIEWSRDCDTAMNPYHFIQSKGIPRQTAKDWCTRIPEFAEGFQVAKDFIALRREEKYIESNPAGALSRMMSFYDDDYKVQEERLSSLKNKEQEQQKQNITIVIPDISIKEQE